MPDLGWSLLVVSGPQNIQIRTRKSNLKTFFTLKKSFVTYYFKTVCYKGFTQTLQMDIQTIILFCVCYRIFWPTYNTITKQLEGGGWRGLGGWPPFVVKHVLYYRCLLFSWFAIQSSGEFWILWIFNSEFRVQIFCHGSWPHWYLFFLEVFLSREVQAYNMCLSWHISSYMSPASWR